MRPRIDRSISICRFNPSAPEDGLPVFVHRLQLQPEIEGINCASGESVPHVPCPNHHIDPNLFAAPNRCIRPVDRCYKFRYVRYRACCVSLTSAIHHVEGTQLRSGRGRADTRCSMGLDRCCGTECEDIDAHLIVLKKIDRCLELVIVLVHEWKCRIRCGKSVAVHLPVDICRVF